MKKFGSLFVSLSVMVSAFAQELGYYLPKNVSYNSAVPVPASVIGHEVGEWHVTHDRLVNYMKAIDQASDRVVLSPLGFTNEGRQQLALIITSPKNHQRLESIRQQHLQLTDAGRSGSLNIEEMPVVVWMGYSIHGNESSGANASLLAAYYLAAAEGADVDQLLSNTVIILDPSFNPDGLNRFATWANMHKGQTMVADPNAREFNEVWPGGRFNHYWFDLNRDWLPAQHRESQNRLSLFHQWKPNILTDHHEMGSNSSFFFQPGVPSRVNPNTPARNQELTGAIGNYHAKFLDSIGSMYFTKEGYDDFYYGKGSTYPDINGSIGILFEQASSRGHAQETENGLLTFPFTIRNQFTTTLSTLAAARGLRKELLNFQRDFYRDVQKESTAYPVKAYVFGDENDKARTDIFIQMLLRHEVEIYQLRQNYSTDGKNFKTGSAYVIPTNQKQFKIIKTVFERTFDYKDSLFYDVTAWTMPLAFGLPYSEIKVANTFLGSRLEKLAEPQQQAALPANAYAYAFRWNGFYSPKLLYRLQSKGVVAKVATKPFKMIVNGQEETFGFGTIVLPSGMQKLQGAALSKLIDEAAAGTGVEIIALGSGLASGGIDIGSSSFVPLKTPQVMMFGGVGTSPTDVGEIWHMLDTRFNIPVSIVDVDRAGGINLSRYNVVIMPSGAYQNLSKPAQDKIREWISGGGTLVATEDAVKWLATNGFTKTAFRNTEEKKDSTRQFPFYLRSDETRAKDMAGSIFEAKMDLSHPLAYGYTRPSVSIFKSNTLFMEKSTNPYNSPVVYTEDPLQSGYLYRAYKNVVKNAAAVNIDPIGRGRVISMPENLTFRAFWLGTNKMFMNAICFGNLIN
jgi:Zinc carboxypeptidase